VEIRVKKREGGYGRTSAGGQAALAVLIIALKSLAFTLSFTALVAS
jgi:hypothetical protein